MGIKLHQKDQPKQPQLVTVKCLYSTNAAKIERQGSVLYNKQNKDDTVGLVGEITETANAVMNSEEGLSPADEFLVGQQVSLRVSRGQFEEISMYIDDEKLTGGLAITVQLKSDDHVRVGMLDIKGEEQLSVTIYAWGATGEETEGEPAPGIVEVEYVPVPKVGNIYPMAKIIEELKKNKQRNEKVRSEAIARNRMQSSSAGESSEIAEEEIIEIRS